MLKMKSGEKQITEQNNQIKKESERLEKKKITSILVYIGVLEADTIKQAEMKEKIKKSPSDERGNFSKGSAAAEISSKRQTRRQFPLCIFHRGILKMNKKKM